MLCGIYGCFDMGSLLGKKPAATDLIKERLQHNPEDPRLWYAVLVLVRFLSTLKFTSTLNVQCLLFMRLFRFDIHLLNRTLT